MKKKICSGGFIKKETLFLFGKRSTTKDWGPGLWDIVGGKAKKNEDPLAALIRETKEELGVLVKKAELITIVDIDDSSDKYLFTYYIYRITEYEGIPFNCSDEHSVIGWFTREELSGMQLALPDYLEMIDSV